MVRYAVMWDGVWWAALQLFGSPCVSEIPLQTQLHDTQGDLLYVEDSLANLTTIHTTVVLTPTTRETPCAVSTPLTISVHTHRDTSVQLLTMPHRETPCAVESPLPNSYHPHNIFTHQTPDGFSLCIGNSFAIFITSTPPLY